MKKHILPLLLALALCLNLGPVVRAAGGQCGDGLTWQLADGVLTISGTGAMYDYPGDAPWEDQRNAITTLIVEEGVTAIGSHAFDYCMYMTEARLPATLTAIGEGAFGFCYELAGVTLPEGLTELGTGAFQNCEKLTALTIPGGVTVIPQDCFSGSGLTAITLPEGITELGRQAFMACSGLSGITLPDSLLTIGSRCFEGCTALTEITIPASVTTIPELCFSGSGLIRIELPDGLTAIGDNAFVRCRALSGITIPQSVTQIGDYAFRSCEALTELTLPQGITEIAWGLFQDAGLQRLEIPHGVTELRDYAFYGCDSFTELFLPCTVDTIGYEVFTGCDRLTISCCADTFAHRYAREQGLPFTLLPDPESEPFYPITTEVEDSGSILIDTDSSRAFRYVQFRVEAAEGWYLESLRVYYDSETALELDLIRLEEGLWEFRMPACGVKIRADFWCDADLPEACDHIYGPWQVWKYPSSSTEGEERRTCTVCGGTDFRVMEKLTNPFADVSPEAYSYEPILWAASQGITSGTAQGLFSPEEHCTRAQIVTFLWRSQGSPEPSGDVPFTDVSADDYFHDAVAWAVEEGITLGTSATTFGSDEGCTRAQVATFLWRSQGSPAPAESGNPFTDVGDGEYYRDPVLWAVEEGITLGTDPGLFSPGDTCTRAQIVTFLYRSQVN